MERDTHIKSKVVLKDKEFHTFKIYLKLDQNQLRIKKVIYNIKSFRDVNLNKHTNMDLNEGYQLIEFIFTNGSMLVFKNVK